MCSGQIFVIALELVARRTSPKKIGLPPGRTYFWELILVNGEEWIVLNS